MAKKGKNTILIILGVLLLALLVFAAYKSRSKPKGIEVTTEEVTKRTIREQVSASGKVFPETEVKISSDISGEIVELFVEEGDTVKAGQLLGRIDADTYQSQVQRSQATVSNARAQVANSEAGVARAEAILKQSEAQRDQITAQAINTRAIHTRNRGLFDEGIISAADFESSTSTLDGIEANLKSAEATIASNRANLEAARQSVNAAEFNVKSAQATLGEVNTSLRRTNIVAPMDGIISRLDVEQGERVVGTLQMAGTEMMRVADLSTIEVQVDVSENDVLRVNVGDPAEIEVDAYLDEKFTGYVTEIANSATNSTAASLTTDQVTNFVVKIRINPESYREMMLKSSRFPFRPGMSASVDINTNTEKDVLTIPIQAVTTRDLNQVGKKKRKKGKKKQKKEDVEENIKEVVFVMEADTARMIQVKAGIQDDKYIQILEGLSEGMEIIEGPYSVVSKKLEQGEEIRVEE